MLILEDEFQDLNLLVVQTPRSTLQTITAVSLPRPEPEKMLSSRNKKFRLRKKVRSSKLILNKKSSFKVYKIASRSWKPNVDSLTICKKRTNFSKRGWIKLSRPKKL